MSESTPEKLAELRRLLDAATPRPWMACEDEDEVLIVLDDDSNHWPGRYTAIARGFEQGDDYGLSDAMLVTAAVDALPALLDAAEERDALSEWREKVAIAAGMADDLRGEGHGVYLETDPDRAAEHVANLRTSASDHDECPVLCDEGHDEQWEWPMSCPHCLGSGVAGPSIIEFIDGVVPDNLAHPGECDYCAGDGRWHTNPHNLVTFDYAKEMEAVVLDDLSAMKAERDALAAAVRELTEAIRFTVEYVGLEMLPPIDGWSWFDALVKYDPLSAAQFVRERGSSASDESEANK